MLSVKGKIRAQEIRVELTSWPDFVFSPDYSLPALRSVEQYVQAHHHLPGIPSAKEVAENGVLLGDLNARLLQKIEELTLQLIRLDKRASQQAQRIATLERKRTRALTAPR